jgi:hypothetical protein
MNGASTALGKEVDLFVFMRLTLSSYPILLLASIWCDSDPFSYRFDVSSEFFWACVTWQKLRIVNSTHKLSLHRWCGTDKYELYNLARDPLELNNVAGQVCALPLT